MFSYEFFKITKNVFITEHVWATASVSMKLTISISIFQKRFAIRELQGLISHPA